jgi:hypothetical protein
MEEAKKDKHDEIGHVYKLMNGDERKTLIRVADRLLKAQASIQRDKSSLGEEKEAEREEERS